MAYPTIRRERGLLIIEIPEENVICGVENTPRDPVKVIDREAFLNALVAGLLDHEDGTYDAPLFFKPIEDYARELADNGEGCVEPKLPERSLIFP